MKTQKEIRATLQLLTNSAFKIETMDYLPKLHQNMLFVGKRGSGKSVASTNLLRMLKETGSMDRILVISPTFNSNKALMKKLNIHESDIFNDPDDPSLVQRILKIVESERDEFTKYKHMMENYHRITNGIKRGLIDPISEDMDEYLLAYYDVVNNRFRPPKPKYERFRDNKPPILALFIDDCQCTKLMSNRRFFNMVLRHRHLGMFEDGGAVGLTLFITAQTYKAQSGGLNRCVRNNATSLCLFRTKDESELKQIAESFSGEIETEKFIELYQIATEEPHSFLFVDLHPKDTHPSMFRKNFDTYLIPEIKSQDTVNGGN